MYHHCDWLANLELCAEDVDLIIGVDLVIVLCVREVQWQHALLLQVGLMNTGK